MEVVCFESNSLIFFAMIRMLDRIRVRSSILISFLFLSFLFFFLLYTEWQLTKACMRREKTDTANVFHSASFCKRHSDNGCLLFRLFTEKEPVIGTKAACVSA